MLKLKIHYHDFLKELRIQEGANLYFFTLFFKYLNYFINML